MLPSILLPAVAAGLILIGTTASDGAGQASRLAPESPPLVAVQPPAGRLRAGDRAEVRVRADDPASCTLAVSAARSRVALDAGHEVAWTWTIPDSAAAGTYPATVRCSRRGVGGGAEARVQFVLGVEGVAGGSQTRAVAGEFSVEVRDSEPDGSFTASDAADWAQLGALIFAAVSAGVIVLQLHQARNQHQIERAAGMLNRYYEREFSTELSRSLGFLTGVDAGTCVERIRSYDAAPHSEDKSLATIAGTPRPSRNDIKHVVNFFEEMAGAYNAGQLDRELSRRLLANLAVEQLNNAWWYICWLRGGRLGGREPRDSRLYIELEVMVADVRRQQPSLGDALTATPMILCLPPKGARRDAWIAHGRLSNALTHALAASGGWTRPEKLLAALNIEGSVPDPEAQRRVIAVPPPGAEAHAAHALAAAADAVQAHLNRLDRAGIDALTRRAFEPRSSRVPADPHEGGPSSGASAGDEGGAPKER